MRSLKWSMLILAALWSGRSFAYPENVRYGYANCASCHVSPTGGGLLTPYGRGSAEELLSTWSSKGEAGLLHKDTQLPAWLIAGGEFRSLAFQKDTQVYKEKGVIPMQAELQGGVTWNGLVTAVASLGTYDKDIQSQTFYVLGNVGEHVFARGGRFFPAFGINRPDHAIVTRRGLGFNEGQQTLNAEVGVVGETGEVILDAVLGRPGEISDEERGFVARSALYAGGKSQIGLNAMMLKGTVWERNVTGAFVTTGLTSTTYLLAEFDKETKKAVEKDDASTQDTSRFVSADKVGWEMARGVHLLATYESSVTTDGTYDNRYWAAGPGVQWFPRPHFELLAQAQKRLDRTWSDEPGSLLTLMLHYNL